MLKALRERLRGLPRADAPVVVDMDDLPRADAPVVVDMDDLPRADAPVVVVDTDEAAAWIAAETGTELDTVARVLDLEAELQEGVGLAYPPRTTFLYYDKADFAGLAPEDAGDLERIAGDAERLLKIPRALAHVVLDAETRYLTKLGL